MALQSGVRVGAYEVVSPLGSGGMGEVYRARDAKLGRDVALKLLPAALAHDSQSKARLEQLGPSNEPMDRMPNPMKLEAWPGGRWFRDLGDGNGHRWATVEAIKRPTLLEFSGPLFVSYPVANNVQYRLSEENGETVIKFSHAGFGMIREDHEKGVVTGWGYIH
jgi:serine/threonine protein kinase